MYAATFDYHRATTLKDAQQLLRQHPGAKLLAGGHSLLPLLKLRLAAPSAVVDIGRIAELRGIAEEGNAIRIGALTTHAELAASAELKRSAAALAEAAATVGDPAVRNRGTIGGNVAHADPASDLPAVLVALDAGFIALGASGERTIAADDFFTGLMSTALNEHEILVGVRVPAAAAGQGSAYVKFSHPASRYAVIGVAARVTVANGTCTGARIALGGLLPHARRAAAVEQALVGTSADAAAIARAAAAVAADLGGDVTGDIYASAQYRAAVAPVYIRRAVAAAVARAGLAQS
jgi:aerobic carbon-monoxide dehydrogenase medium subunit